MPAPSLLPRLPLRPPASLRTWRLPWLGASASDGRSRRARATMPPIARSPSGSLWSARASRPCSAPTRERRLREVQPSSAAGRPDTGVAIVDGLAVRRAVVTGGARATGAAMARTFLEEGADVVIFDLNGDGAAATAASIGEGCRGRAVDVRSETQVDEAFAELESSGFAVDLLVNDAAIQRSGARRSDGRGLPCRRRHEPS